MKTKIYKITYREYKGQKSYLKQFLTHATDRHQAINNYMKEIDRHPQLILKIQTI